MPATIVREEELHLPPPDGGRPRAAAVRKRRRPWVLTGLSAAIAVALVLPLAFLLLQAKQIGWSTLRPLLFRRLTLDLLWNTVSLTVVVTLLCAVVGTLAAWFVERTDLPGRRLWAVLVVVPLGIPDFVTSFGWRSIFQSLGGFSGATLVMTVAVYPLVYLPVAASFRNADPAQEEVARSLGLGRLRTFWRVTLGQARPAIIGGSLLVVLIILAEYGAFEILGFRTFTTEIFTESHVAFGVAASCALSLVLVLFGALVLVGEGATRGRGRSARLGPLAPRPARPQRLGRATVPALGGFVLLVVLALGVPLGAIAYWLVQGGRSTLPGASIASAVWHTALYGGAAGLVATGLALPVALLSVRHPSRLAAMLERTTYVVLAIPGLVIALSLTYVTERYAAGFLYQSTVLLIVAYAVMFFPLALVAVRTSVLQSPAGLEEMARSLGSTRLAVLWRVTLPLVGPGLAAAFSLVFLETVTELTATLILIPTGAQTLSTQFWAFSSNISYSQAAPYAALMVLVAALPSYVLGRWFDRLPSRSPAAP